MRAITGIASVAIVAVGLFVGLSALPDRASAAAGDVSIIALSCDTNPEYVRIKNFGVTSQSLSGFHIESDPSQDYTLTDFVSSIVAGQTLEFQSGSAAAADSALVYRMTGAFILRNSDPTDYARLIRPGTTSDQVNCGETPTTPIVPTSTPTPTVTLTATPVGQTPTPAPTPTATATPVGQTPSLTTPTPTVTLTATPVGQTPSPTLTLAPTPTATPVGQTLPPTLPPKGTPREGESVVWGDANCSGSADPVDSLLTLRADAGLSTNTGDCPFFGQIVSALVAALYTWGDVDCSGSVNPVDSLKLLRFDAGLSVSQEANCPTIGGPI